MRVSIYNLGLELQRKKYEQWGYMRLLFVNKASLRHEGGAEIRTREVGRRLVALGHEVVVLAAKTNIQDPPSEVLDGMRVYHKKVLPDWMVRRFPAPRYISLAAANLFLMVHLHFLLRKEKFDLIRDDISPFPPTFLMALKRLPPARRIAVVHNLPGTLKGWLKYYGPIYGLAGFAMDQLLRAGRLKYDRIICAGKWFANELKQYPNIADRVAYIPNGVNLADFTRKEERNGVGPIIRLLCVGRLAETKGHRYLIEAIASLKGEYPGLKLDILGEGPLKDSLVSLIRQRGLDDMVTFRSPVGHKDMPPIYREYDFLVMPSLFEGFPVTLIEAMASGLPIVGTDIPGIAGVLDDSLATLAKTENASDFAHKLKWAIDHPVEISQKTDAAYVLSKKYNWDVVASQEIEA